MRTGSLSLLTVILVDEVRAAGQLSTKLVKTSLLLGCETVSKETGVKKHAVVSRSGDIVSVSSPAVIVCFRLWG